MEINDQMSNRVKTLEGELRLIKGELKETLSSVRDYLMSFKLPSPGNADFLKYIDGEDEQKIVMGGAVSHNSDVNIIESSPSRIAPGEQAQSAAGEIAERPSVGAPGSSAVPTGTLPGEVAYQSGAAAGSSMNEAELSASPAGSSRVGGEGQARQGEMAEWATGVRDREEEDHSTPRINLLSNLIRWVSHAKKEIGGEQLETFLEVYGISGHLSSELKEVVMQLVEITEPSSEDTSAAEIWSKLILELHGIITGNDAPLHFVKPLSKADSRKEQLEETEATEEVVPEKPEEKPLKLKLVITNGDNKEREFSINLNPEVNRES